MFKQLCSIGALALAASVPLPALAQPDVGVSVHIGQPGFYGRIDIGNAPPPQLIYREPVIIQEPAYRIQRAPIYLHVPPGHAKNWRRHCARYNACGQPVYFVQDRWYNDVYVPRHRAGPPPGYRAVRPGYEPPHVHRGGRAEWQRDRHEDRRHRQRDDRGHGRGHDRDRDRDR